MTTVSIRLTDSDKKALDAFCEDVGFNLSTLFNIYVKKIVHENRIPFSLESSSDPFYSTTNVEALRESINQYQNGEVVEMSIDELKGFE